MKTSDFRIGDIVSVDNLTECKVIEIKEKHLRVEYIREDTQLPHRPLIEIERISPVKLSQDKMYSEEDMIEFAKWVFLEVGSNTGKDRTNKELFNEWFEQFKNK